MVVQACSGGIATPWGKEAIEGLGMCQEYNTIQGSSVSPLT